MDAFFASVEQRDRPELRGRPVAVGGLSSRSVVAAASYEARIFGVHSAMPVYQALRLCPALVVVPVDKSRYSAVSRIVMGILHGFTPLVEQVSIDEAFLDISGSRRLLGTHRVISLEIKKRIASETGLTCSIGAAPVKFLAKVASDKNKPDGIFIIEPDEALEFARCLEISKVPGVGKRAMEQMQRLGIRTLGDIARFDPDLLARTFGKFSSRLIDFAHARDSSSVDSTEQRKSLSSESTLPRDTTDMEEVRRRLLSHAQEVGRDLRKKGLLAGNVVVKIKFSDFTQVTRQKQFKDPVCSSSALYAGAVGLMESIAFKKPVRLTGLGVSVLADARTPRQMDLFDPVSADARKWELVDRALDTISEKFGSHTVNKASLGMWDKRCAPQKGGTMTDTLQLHVSITGTVQGVFFRAETKRAADSLNVRGWVRNRRDGSVEAVFEGDEEAIKSMVQWCRTGPRAASVDQVQTRPLPGISGYTGFDIRR